MECDLTCYLDIVLEPDAEISAPALLNNLFAKLHRALVQSAKGDIGVSFPKYGKTLGDALRLHGSCAALETIMATPWLKGLRDYTEVGNIEKVPEKIKGYRTVFRVQQKSPQNMRKRSVAKGWLSEIQAQEQIPDTAQKCLSQPFILLKSVSTQQHMMLFIQYGALKKTPQKGGFSRYGLSKESTIPWF